MDRASFKKYAHKCIGYVEQKSLRSLKKETDAKGKMRITVPDE
jgi:hypothetical protein